MTEPLDSKVIVERWEELVIDKREGACNCDRCIQERTKEHWETLLLLAYPAIGFVPRNRDIRIRFNGYEQDAMYEHPKRALQLTLANIKRLRTSNKKIKLSYNKLARKSLVYCYDCGVLHESAHSKKYDGRFLCSSCGERYEVCSDCGSLVDKYHVYSVNVKAVGRGESAVNGIHYRLVCDECIHDYVECNNCGSFSAIKETKIIPYQRNSRGDVQMFHACPVCFERYGRKCAGCGSPTMNRIGEAVTDDTYYCPTCAEERGGVMSHTFQPLVQRFHKGKTEGKVTDKALYFGFELEIDSWKSAVRDNNTMAYLIKEQVGSNRVYMVHDGTITRDSDGHNTGRSGIEVVSHPFTWERYRCEDVDVWDNMLLYCRNKGWKSNTPQCGMHIHTTKAAWGTLQIYKLLQFMYNKKNKAFIIDIAQRVPNKYCAMDKKDYDEAAYVAKEKKNRDRQHYSIINLNNKRGGEGKTIEFRMFRGTLEPLYFHKNIEFVHAIFHFTLDFPRSKMLEKDFKQFVAMSHNKYPHLFAFINRNNKGGR